MLLDRYAPLKRINKYKLTFNSKLRFRLRKINIREKQITNFINKKDPLLNDEFFTNYKKK